MDTPTESSEAAFVKLMDAAEYLTGGGQAERNHATRLREAGAQFASSLKALRQERDQYSPCWGWGEHVRSVFEQMQRDKRLPPDVEAELEAALFPTRNP